MKHKDEFKRQTRKGHSRQKEHLCKVPEVWRDEVFEDLHFHGSDVKSKEEQEGVTRESWSLF